MTNARSVPTRNAETESLSPQQWGALVGGSALAILGLTRRSPGGIALVAAGGALAYIGATTNNAPKESVAHGIVVLNCSAEEAFKFWRDFENLPLFMRHIESVTVASDGTSKWVAIGPLGTRIQWRAEVVREREGEFIHWRSLPDSDISVGGTVEFRQAPGKRGVVVEAKIRYIGLTGTAGRAAAKMMGKDPSFLMQQDMRRFKALVETGEIPTIEGQTHGPRSAATALIRLIDPDQPVPRNAKPREILEQMRRIA